MRTNPAQSLLALHLNMPYKSTLSILVLALCLFSCFHTAKINNLHNYGARLTSEDVILFTGYENKDSRTSKVMLEDMTRLLGKCGIQTKYLYDPEFNNAFLEAGFTSANADVDNDKFMYQMKELYGISHIFSVGHVRRYEGDMMNVNKVDEIYERSGLIFEVYSLEEEKVVSSMKITGNTFMINRGGVDKDSEGGSVFNNYRKGIKKLLKSAECE